MVSETAAGDRDYAGVTANRLSLLVLLDGELDAADALVHQALELMGARWSGLSAALFDAAGAIRESFGAPPTWYECPFHDRIAAQLDATLDPDERRQATERAAGLPDDQAALALTVELLRAEATASG